MIRVCFLRALFTQLADIWSWFNEPADRLWANPNRCPECDGQRIMWHTIDCPAALDEAHHTK